MIIRRLLLWSRLNVEPVRISRLCFFLLYYVKNSPTLSSWRTSTFNPGGVQELFTVKQNCFNTQNVFNHIYIMTLNLSVEWDVRKVTGLNTARWNVESESKRYLDLSGSCVVITRRLKHTLIEELLNQSLGLELFHTKLKCICEIFTQAQDFHLGVLVACCKPKTLR